MRRLQGGAILSQSKRYAPYGPIDGEFLFLVSATLKLSRGRNAHANTYCASAKVGREGDPFSNVAAVVVKPVETDEDGRKR